ncbi:MAG: ATP-binding cassette domain-containing protein [Oscillospiraceae bacterium]|nr:ATP-binding cassette domain-containing protein [Oscillospiraceae bacterium]
MKILPFSKTYEDRCVLDFPGMELQPGTIYAIIGANGSGKSTFAKILAGILPGDQKGRFLDTHAVGYMPQKNYAFRMTTKANILLNGKDAARANALMDAIQIRHLENKRADKLSGGETARMALVRLMMKRYDIVILDEPTAAMDMETTLLSEKLIVDYVRKTGCTLILVTHSLQQARRVADEVLYFHKGKLLESGPQEQVLYKPVMAETRQFLEFYGV